MSEKVAVIGMGQMASGMAGRCRFTTSLAMTSTPISAAGLAKDGFQMASSIAEALAGRALALTSLPDPKAVLEAWLGADGIVAHAAKGTLCIELSTIDPQERGSPRPPLRAASRLSMPGQRQPNEARSGKLILIAGGEMADVTSRRTDLQACSASTGNTPGVGTAKVVKIVNNMMSMGNVLVAAEAFALGVAAGVEPDKLYDVLSVSGGRSHHFTKRFPQRVKGDFSPGFKLELGEKDLALAVELGQGDAHARRRRLPQRENSTRWRWPRDFAARTSSRYWRCIRTGPSPLVAINEGRRRRELRFDRQHSAAWRPPAGCRPARSASIYRPQASASSMA